MSSKNIGGGGEGIRNILTLQKSRVVILDEKASLAPPPCSYIVMCYPITEGVYIMEQQFAE